MNWFDVDRKGLAKLLERRGKVFAVYELVSNAWDTDAKEVSINLAPIPGVAKASLTISDDDPNGFADLTHAFTLFAESTKKGNAEKRGRFNLGEKLVLAVCDHALIKSTKGQVSFTDKGRFQTKQGTDKGSTFKAVVRMTHAECAEAYASLRLLIPPEHCTTYVNSVYLEPRKPVAAFEATLPTEIADAEGNLRRTARKTMVRVYEPRVGETAMLYELGIPVVATEDRWHVDIQQKVPLNMDRDNVTPAFLRQVRTLVVNALHEQLKPDDANQPWVREATSDDDCSPEATERVMTLRFGEKRVAYDPSDPEANSLAVSKGFTVVHGGMMNATEWKNAKKAEAILPAGQVTPSPKPFSPDGAQLKMVELKDYTKAMHNVVSYTSIVGKALLGRDLIIKIANDIAWPFGAAYGNGALTFNLGRLGHAFFESGPGVEVNRLLLHEFGHEYEGDHLSAEYHEALCKLGAKLAQLALDKPSLFIDHQGDPP